MLISRKKYEAEIDNLSRECDRAQREIVQQQNENTQNYVMMRNLLTAFMFGNIKVKTVSLDENRDHDILLVCPKSLEGQLITVNITKGAK